MNGEKPPRQQLSTKKTVQIVGGPSSVLKLSRSRDGRTVTFDNQTTMRKSSASGQRPIKLLADKATSNMSNLKNIVGKSKKTGKQIEGELQQQYKARKESLDRELQKVIDNSKVAMMKIYEKNKKEREEELRRQREAEKGSGLMQLLGVKNDSQNEDEEGQGKVIADGFVRSKQSQALMVKDEIMRQIKEIEIEKLEIIQKLNKALIELDKINSSKRDIGNKLLEQVKFVRDLQRAAANGDDIQGVVSVQMKIDFQREKELNARLLEELKRCEQEKLRILQRVKLLSGEKEVVVQTSDGLQKTFKVTQVNIQNVINDLKSNKDRIGSQEELIHRSREVLRVSEEDIKIQERELADLMAERDQYYDRISQIEGRYRLMFDNMEGDRFTQRNLHRMHVKLLATRQFEESFQKVLGRRRKSALHQMLEVTRGYVSQFGAVYRLRGVLITSNERLQRNALVKWYKIACDPIMLIKQNEDIPNFYQKYIVDSSQFNTDFEAWMLKNYKNHQKQAALRDFKGILNKLSRRYLRNFYDRWRQRLQKGTHAVSVLDRFLSKVRLRWQMTAYAKWKNYMLNQDFTIRVQGFSVMVATNRLETMIFQSWRQWAKTARFKRHQLLRKCMRIMRVAVKRRKNFRCMKINAIMFNRQSNKNILKQTFDALRQHKEDSKFGHVTEILENQERPMINLLTYQVDGLQELQNLNMRQKCLVSIINLAKRCVANYFHEWREQTQRVRVGKTHKFAQLLIKLCREKQQKGFNAFRYCLKHKEIVTQIAIMDEIYINNMETTEMSRQNERKIRQAVCHGNFQGSMRVKRFMQQVQNKRIQRYFDRWNQQNTKINKMQSASHLILRKIRCRLLRMAFNKYRHCVDWKEQDQKNEYRLEEVRAKLQYRAKRRCYLGIKSHATKFKQARKFLKTLINRLDKFNKDLAVRRWQDYWRQGRAKDFHSQQNQLIEQVLIEQQQNGLVANELQAAREKLNKATKSYKTQCSKTLQKWAFRLLNASLSTAFNTWKNQRSNLNYRDRVLFLCRQRLTRNMLRTALSRWQSTREIAMIMTIEENIVSTDLKTQCANSTMEQIREQRKQQAVQHGFKREQIYAEKSRIDQMHANVVKVMTDRNQNCFMTGTRRDIFNHWRDYAKARRKCCRTLVRLMTQSLNQRTFNRIRNHGKDKEARKDYVKISTKMIRKLQRYWLKRAFNQWRTTEFMTTMMLIQETTIETQGVVQDFEIKKQNVKKHHVAVQSGRQSVKSLREWFDNWRKWAWEEKDIRERSIKLQKALAAKRGSNALKKWQERTKVTRKLRIFLRRGTFENRFNCMKLTFQAWKQQFQIERDFSYSIGNFANSMRFWSLKRAFGAIQERARDVRDTKNKNTKKTQLLLLSSLGRYVENSKQLYLIRWKTFTDICGNREAKLKAALIKIDTRQYRAYFDRWKFGSSAEATTIQHEQEDGPTNIECWYLRQQNLNLMRMLKDDGITNSQITQIQAEIEDRYKILTEKSLCRFLCKQGDDLYLLPAALDRWKQYTQMRKVWRRVLKSAEIRATRTNDAIVKLWAFRRLQYTHSDRVQELKQLPIKELRTMAVKGVEELDRLADNIEYGDKEIQSLTDQRNVLFKGQMSGQKLALALGRDNYHMTKMKALSNLQTYGTQRIQLKIEEALQANLQRITALKDSISRIEADNEELATQNDQFRVGAMDGIQMVRHVENLTQDRDKLSVDLADKAITIRKLLEDNSYLRNRIDQVTGFKQKAERDLNDRRSPSRENDMNAINQQRGLPVP